MHGTIARSSVPRNSRRFLRCWTVWWRPGAMWCVLGRFRHTLVRNTSASPPSRINVGATMFPLLLGDVFCIAGWSGGGQGAMWCILDDFDPLWSAMLQNHLTMLQNHAPVASMLVLRCSPCCWGMFSALFVAPSSHATATGAAPRHAHTQFSRFHVLLV